MRMDKPFPQVTEQLGQIVAVHGTVVDIRFLPPLPPRNRQLETATKPSVVLEVQTHLDGETVRCIALIQQAGSAVVYPCWIRKNPCACRSENNC